LNNRCGVKVTVERAKRVSFAQDCGVNNQIILHIGGHNPRRRSWKHNLRNLLASQVAKVFELCGRLHALIPENALKLLQQEGGYQERVFQRSRLRREAIPERDLGVGMGSDEDSGI
jgi:hypothetical protein